MTSCQQASSAAMPPYLPLITNRTVAASVAFGSTATAQLLFDGTTGDLTTAENLVFVNRTPEWDRDRGIVPPGGQWYIRLTVLSGIPPTGGDSIGNFLLLSNTGRGWSLARSILGTSTGSWQVDIAFNNPGQIAATAVYSVTAATVPP